MADEQKPEQKSPVLEPPKDIEELLKELPKVDAPKPPAPPKESFRLPTGQAKPFVPPPPASPLKPLSPQPLRPTPSPSYPPPPKPISPPIPQTDKFKSLVRTMDEDLEAAKKGIKPESKPFEIKPPPKAIPPFGEPSPSGGPKIAPPPPPLKMPTQAPQIKLGPAERTKPLESPKLGPPAPPIGAAASKKFNLNLKILIIVLVVILTAFAGAWWFLNREPEIVFTPTPTPTPTPVFPGLFEIFGEVYPIIISSTDDFAASFNNSIKNVSPLTAGKFTALSVTDENGSRYPLSEIFRKLQISVPTGLLENLAPNEWLFVAYGQKESFDQNGLLTFNQTPKIKLGLIAKAADTLSLRSALNGWEITLTDDLNDFFGISLTKATSEAFLDNIYGGADVRYRNFPYADNSIDYAIVNLPQFNLNYFVLTNSKESIYSAIDLFRQ